jgi:hypothetical protein
MAETPRFAHLMILLLMGTELSVALSLSAALFGAVTGRRLLAMFAGGAALTIAGGYACLLLGVGRLSGERILAPGQWKYFCEADCHIAYSIEDAQTANPSDGGPGQRSIGSRRVEVRLKTWFDENSIAKFRGNGPLAPEPRLVVLEDGDGRSYLPLPRAEFAPGEHSTPMTQALRPGESYLTSFVFEVPREAQDLRLLVTDADPATRIIIDHENSPFHGKILLDLPAARQAEPMAGGAESGAGDGKP